MIDRTIPIDIVMSSLDSIEGGIIILDKNGKVAHVNDWILKHCQSDRDILINQKIEDVFVGVSPALLNALEQARSSKLSRMLSHKMHKQLLPLHVNNQSGQHKLDISVLVTPLSEVGGVLLRVIDYTALVRRETQIRFNEKLLTLEKDFLSRAPNLSESLAEYIEAFTDRVNRLPHPFHAQVAVIINDHFLRFIDPSHPASYKSVESIILSRSANDAIHEISQIKDSSGAIFHAINDVNKEKVKGYIVFTSTNAEGNSHLAHKNLLKITDLVNNLIEWKTNYEKLHFLANNDILTGLLNRGALTTAFNNALKESDKLSLLFIDLNKFKQVNDVHGHHIGDKVLQKMASKINSVLAPDDLAFRIGGDEFVILRKHANNIKELEASLLETISKSFLCESIPISMSASVGYASYPEHGQSLNELLLVSDKHMYHHKNSKQGTLEL